MKKAYIVQRGEYAKIMDDDYEQYLQNLQAPEKIFLNFEKAVTYCQNYFTKILNLYNDRPMLKKKIAATNIILYSDVLEEKEYDRDYYFVGEQDENGSYPLTYVEEDVKVPLDERLKYPCLGNIFIIFEVYLEE